MESCLWFWDGLRWVESPEFPHHCPEGHDCPEPAFNGIYYGQESSTACAL